MQSYRQLPKMNLQPQHCRTTSLKVAGSIPDGITGIFRRLNPSGHTMALGSNQPLTKMSIREISWGVKVADLTTNHMPTV